ncbi:MAG: ATP-grasp domain-containing protein, partial [Myxococcales bacterium]|nr:ATP-grasp domain-containing protein [Myxococcales bacterium]
MKIKKILIANRGEIAVRVIRACQEMGIETVAVFSEAERGAMHVHLADEAYEIGPAAPSQSYLRAEKVLEVALSSGAEAIHPGYGFLSENEDFAEAVARAGLIFIGPKPEVIAAMGSKTAARRAMEAAGVPVVPGFNATDETLDELAAQAERIGYPIMIKAVAGGGGKGMRLVSDPAAFVDAAAGARREALAAFGDGTIYLEKAIIRPRHIEVQVAADHHGNVVHLFERECSIQ